VRTAEITEQEIAVPADPVELTPEEAREMDDLIAMGIPAADAARMAAQPVPVELREIHRINTILRRLSPPGDDGILIGLLAGLLADWQKIVEFPAGPAVLWRLFHDESEILFHDGRALPVSDTVLLRIPGLIAWARESSGMNP
jgi:hypothetical protein